MLVIRDLVIKVGPNLVHQIVAHVLLATFLEPQVRLAVTIENSDGVPQ